MTVLAALPHFSASACAPQRFRAPLSAEMTRLLQYDSRLALPKLARRSAWYLFLVLVASFGSRSRWTRFSQREGDFRTTAPQAEHCEGTKGEAPDLFFSRRRSCTRPCDAVDALFHFVSHLLATMEDQRSKQWQRWILKYRAVLVPLGCERKWLKLSLTAVLWHVCSHCLFCPVTQPCFSFLFLCLKQRFHWCAVWQIFKVFKIPKTSFLEFFVNLKKKYLPHFKSVWFSRIWIAKPWHLVVLKKRGRGVII